MRAHDSTHASLAHTRLEQATTGHKQVGVKVEQDSRASVELAHAVVLVLRARHLDDVAVVVDELGLLAWLGLGLGLELGLGLGLGLLRVRVRVRVT